MCAADTYGVNVFTQANCKPKAIDCSLLDMENTVCDWHIRNCLANPLVDPEFGQTGPLIVPNIFWWPSCCLNLNVLAQRVVGCPLTPCLDSPLQTYLQLSELANLTCIVSRYLFHLLHCVTIIQYYEIVLFSQFSHLYQI